MNLDFDYYDPDAEYKDDVLAFVNAVNDRIKKLSPLLNKPIAA